MNSTLRKMVYASLFAALIIVGGYLSLPVPMSPVPLVLSDLFIILAGLALGSSWGAVSIGMFLLLGLAGLPVFAGGKAGLAVLAGPTGGYLIGYLTGGALAGWVSGQGKPSVARDSVGIVLGYLMIFSCGVAWLVLGQNLDLKKALVGGLVPFLPGSGIKAVVAAFLIAPVRKIMAEQE